MKLTTTLAVFAAGVAGGLGFATTTLAAPPSVDIYGQLPAVEMMRLSPDGDKIAFITVTGSDRKLHVTTADGAILHEVDCSDIKLRALDWADDNHVVLSATVTMRMSRASDEAAEFLNVVSLNVSQHRLYVVFNNQAQVLPLVFGEYGFSAADGHAYGYFGGVQQNKLRYTGNGFANLFRVDLDTGDRLFMAPGAYQSQIWLIDPTIGKIAATAISDPHSGEWRVEVGDSVVAKGKADFGPARVLGFARAPAALLTAEPTNGEDLIREVRIDGSGASDVPDGGRINDFVLDRRTGKWIGDTRLGDRQESRFFDPDTEAKWRNALTAVHDDDAGLVSSSDDFSRVIVETEGDNDSGSYWLVDTAAKTARLVGKAYPDVPSDQVGSYSMVDWKAADGLALHGVLTLPPGRPAKGLPLIVLPHGGPQARDYPHFDWWAQAFASRGYAVFQPNFRGSAGYGDALVSAGYGQWGRKMQTDISDGVAELGRRGVIDPKRACIVGGSYGGYAALAGVTVQQGLYRCSVSWGGVADLPLMLHATFRASGSTQTDTTRYWRRFMGADGPEKADLDAVSPAKLAAKADAPILLMYGRDDTVVPPAQSLEMIDELKKAGKPYEVEVMPGEDHWLSRSATRTAMLRAAVGFVEKNNPSD
jgi:dipeptidyl aminopeptidase/acylaminoacyl peptidase